MAKRHLMMVAARNLSTIMRAFVGIGGPRGLQGILALLQTVWIHFERLLSALDRLVSALVGPRAYGAEVAGHRRMTIRRPETGKTTWATASYRSAGLPPTHRP